MSEITWEVCSDNRFEIIENAKQMLLEHTNIETSPEEMAVLDNILFRMWQMGWLPDNHSLTWDEMKGMIGEPVYLKEYWELS